MQRHAGDDAKPPVLMFHSVADQFAPLPWKSIVCSTAAFDTYLLYLKNAGFISISLSDYIGFLHGDRSMPPKSVILTFDDGYLDNWVNAFPILRKYGFKATVFVTTDFIDPRRLVRKTLGDYWEGKIALKDLDWYGYLSWDELKLMVEGGVFEVGSHAVTHTWYFSSQNIVDFHHPEDPYVWFEWNRDPARKPFWMRDVRDGRWGSPVYGFGPALTTKIYYPRPEVERALVEHVRKEGGESFFNRKAWKAMLFNVAADCLKEFSEEGSYESDEEYWERVTHEVISSKKTLEDGLGKRIDTLAWPNDAYNSRLVEIAHEEAKYELTCMVEDCDGEPQNHPWLSRMYIGEKYGSLVWNDLWFRIKMTATGDGIVPGLVKPLLMARKRLRNCYWKFSD